LAQVTRKQISKRNYRRKELSGIEVTVNEYISNNLDHGVDVTLWASKLGRRFDLYENDEEQVVPHVVLQFAVLLE